MEPGGNSWSADWVRHEASTLEGKRREGGQWGAMTGNMFPLTAWQGAKRDDLVAGGGARTRSPVALLTIKKGLLPNPITLHHRIQI